MFSYTGIRNQNSDTIMSHPENCQLPCVPKFAFALDKPSDSSFYGKIKGLLAFPWNRYVKKWLKKAYYKISVLKIVSTEQKVTGEVTQSVALMKGDLVLVRTREEILRTLDPFNELKGCAFLPEMYKYCGTEQRVFRTMQRFIDERDYKPKKTKGIILLENVFCGGTQFYGQCDRCCFLFWREEWLQKINI